MNKSVSMLITVLIGICAQFGCSFVVDGVRGVPQDAVMEENFRRNRPDFDALVGMSDADPAVIRIAHDFTWVKGQKMSGEMGGDRPIGFSDERWTQYKNRFKKLGLDSGLTRSEDGSIISFDAYGFGLPSSGIEKSYVFSRIPQNCGQEALNDVKTLRDRRFACKELGEGWYLWLTR